MLSKNHIVVVILVAIQAYTSLSETIDLQIPDGNLQGQVNSTIRNNKRYHSFRGIPYAKPPEGDLRFANPVKNSPWEGIWDATDDRSECIQYDGSDILANTVRGQEDCLYINVYTPDYNGTNLPVLVWIHGGAFMGGNSSYESFGPDNFLDQGLVFVSFNHRLGIFGFLSTEDEACPGNWGIKDQILALKWVQENVAYFGGNPGNVTIYGESSGAASVHLLMQTPLTTGLFHRAIMNSGTSLNLWALNTRAATTADLVAVNLGILTTNSTDLVRKLRQVDAERLQLVGWVTAWTLFVGDALRGLPYAPTMEPAGMEGAVYTKPSDDALNAGNFQTVPVLMGLNSNEANVLDDIPAIIRAYLLNYDINYYLLSPYSMTHNETKRSLAGSEIKSHYFGITPIAASSALLINFISAGQFNRPIRRAANDMSNYTTVYFYEFGYEPDTPGVDESPFEGTGHAEDNNYLFRSYNNYTQLDVKVSNTLALLWSNFAKYGDPTPQADGFLNNFIWNPVDPTSPTFTYAFINETVEESTNPKQSDYDFYTYLWDKYGDEEETTTY